MGRRKSPQEVAAKYRADHKNFEERESKRYYLTVWGGYALSFLVWAGTLATVFYGEDHHWKTGVIMGVLAIPVAGNIASVVGKLQRRH
mgnify:CR=1 FL=1